ILANEFYRDLSYGLVTPIASMISKARGLLGIGDAERVFFGEAAAGIYGILAATPGAFIATVKSVASGMRVPLAGEVLLRDLAVTRGEKVPATLEPNVNPLMQMQRPTTFRFPFTETERQINPTIGRIIGMPGDIAMGIHTFFKITGVRASLEAQAYRMAAKEGLSPTTPEFWNRRSEIVANPTEEMHQQSIEDGYKGTFMQQLGPKGEAWQRLTKTGVIVPGHGRVTIPGLKWVFPFSHIPINLIKATYEHTPLALADADMRADILGKNGGVKQDFAIARVVAGSIIMGYFVNAALNDQATGDLPRDPKERDRWKL